MGISAMRCRPLAVTLKVMRPASQRPRVARYIAFRKAHHRMELATCGAAVRADERAGRGVSEGGAGRWEAAADGSVAAPS
jgi:hypothetical protein